MKLLEFLQKHDIQWQPVKLRSRGAERSKLPIAINGLDGRTWLPKMSDFYGDTRISQEELVRRQTQYPGTIETIAIDTSVIQQVDIDDDNPELLTNTDTTQDLAVHMIQCHTTPWFRSLTKQLPHIFVRLENANSHGKRTTAYWNDKIDVLCGQWSFAHVSMDVMDAEAEIQMIPETYTRNGWQRVHREAGRMVATISTINATRRDDVGALLGLLSIQRATVYSQWVEVGIVLKCLCRLMDEEAMFDHWVQWSAQVPTDSDLTHEQICKNKWETFKITDKFSIGTLHYMAKLDNPAQYSAQFSRQEDRTGAKSVEAKQIAIFLADRYRDRYATVPLPSGGFMWYQFFNHRWYEIGQTPCSFITHVIGREFQAMLDEISSADDSSNCDNALTQAFPQLLVDFKNVDKLHKVINSSFHSMMSVAKFAAAELMDSTFENRLDCAHNLLGFENGVYDLDTGIFRDGRPEDMLSISTGYDYTPIVNDSIRNTIIQFKQAISGSEEMYNYMLDIEAYSLHGDTWIQNMFVHTGTGGNGKSVNGILLRKTFGNYFYAPDVTLFTGKKSMTGGTSSELAKSKGRRLLLSTEPEAGDTLQAARIKYFTGGEVIQARPLYKAPVEFQPQFTIHLQMNQLPNLSSFDGGIARRLKVVPYPYQFVQEPTMEHHRIMDTGLGKQFNTVEYAQQFMLLLLEQFRNRLLGEKEIHYPETANEVTMEYMEDEDCVGEFLRYSVVRTGNPQDQVDAALLYGTFKDSGFGRPDITQTMFGRKAKDAGLRKKRTNRGLVYTGVKIATEPSDQVPVNFVM